MQLSSEKTVFMQKAIYYVSKLFAARGIIELTDRCLNFQVASSDASFGIKDVSIEIPSISDVKIIGGDLHPRVVVECHDKSYEFVLTQAQKLYDYLKEMIKDPFNFNESKMSATVYCSRCGKRVDKFFKYCPWCGAILKPKY